MKKLLLAIPLVAGASWVGASYYTGTQTQSAYDQLLVQLNELKPFTLINEDYSAGLSNSTAITQVMDSNGANAKLLFRLHHAINHSPIGINDNGMRVGAATIKTTVVRDDSIPQEIIAFMESFDNAEPVQINTEVAFDGSTNNQLLISPYEHNYDDVKVRFDGVDYNARVNGDLIVGSGSIGEFLLTHTDGMQFKLSTGSIDTDLKRISQAVYAGSYDIAFDKLSVSAPEMPFDVGLQSIAATSNTDLDSGKLDSQVAFSIGNIDSPLPVTSTSLDARVFGLELSGLKAALEQLSQISLVDQMIGSDPAVLASVMDAYSSMVSSGSGLDYGVKLSTADGDATATFGIRVIDETSPNFPAGGLASVSTLRDVLNVVKVELHAQADAAVVDQSPLAMFMMSPEAQQFVVSDGVTYQSDIMLSDLIVDINGNPMALELMIGELLDMPIESLMEI